MNSERHHQDVVVVFDTYSLMNLYTFVAYEEFSKAKRGVDAHGLTDSSVYAFLNARNYSDVAVLKMYISLKGLPGMLNYLLGNMTRETGIPQDFDLLVFPRFTGLLREAPVCEPVLRTTKEGKLAVDRKKLSAVFIWLFSLYRWILEKRFSGVIECIDADKTRAREPVMSFFPVNRRSEPYSHLSEHARNYYALMGLDSGGGLVEGKYYHPYLIPRITEFVSLIKEEEQERQKTQSVRRGCPCPCR